MNQSYLPGLALINWPGASERKELMPISYYILEYAGDDQ
jgi:hypothetical protein